MKYIYTCPEHGLFEKEFPISKAPKTTRCIKYLPSWAHIRCKIRCKRVYEPITVHYIVGGFYSKENQKK